MYFRISDISKKEHIYFNIKNAGVISLTSGNYPSVRYKDVYGKTIASESYETEQEARDRFEKIKENLPNPKIIKDNSVYLPSAFERIYLGENELHLITDSKIRLILTITEEERISIEGQLHTI